MLRIAEAMCGYAASQLAVGLGPAEARAVAAEAAGELAALAVRLRRLAGLGPGDRRVLARDLTALGWPRQAVADWLGVTDETVRDYYLRSPTTHSDSAC